VEANMARYRAEAQENAARYRAMGCSKTKPCGIPQ